MKKWSIGLAIAAIAVGAAGYLFKQRQTAQASQAAAIPVASIEVLASDLVRVETLALNRTLLVTGTVKATQSAVIKAKVSGDILRVLVKEGQAVKAGQILAQIDTTEFASRVAEREANLKQAQAQLAIAERTLGNNRALVEKGFISTSALDTSQDTLAGNRAQVAALQQQLLQARKTLGDAAVTAPMSGVITERMVSAGDKASPDTRLFTVVHPDSLEFEAAVNPADAAQLKAGMPIQLSADGVAPMPASIARINAAVNAASRTVGIYAAVPAGSAFKSGQFASGVVRMAGKADATVVPIDAVRDEGGRQVVYAVIKGEAGNTLTAQSVKPGMQGEQADGRLMLEVSGIAPGLQIVGKNLGPLRTGVPLRITQPAAAPAKAG